MLQRGPAPAQLLLLLVKWDNSLAHAALFPVGFGGKSMDLLDTGRLSHVHRFGARKTLPGVVPNVGQRPTRLLWAHSDFQVLESANEDTSEEPRPRAGLCGDTEPGKGLHRHISRVCSIGWCWDAPAPLLELCPHVFCSFWCGKGVKGPSPPSLALGRAMVFHWLPP